MVLWQRIRNDDTSWANTFFIVSWEVYGYVLTEFFFGYFKTEAYDDHFFPTDDSLDEVIDYYIYFYNPK